MKTIYSLILVTALLAAPRAFGVTPSVPENVETVSQFASNGSNVGERWCEACGKFVKSDGDFATNPGDLVHPYGAAAPTKASPTTDSKSAR